MRLFCVQDNTRNHAPQTYSPELGLTLGCAFTGCFAWWLEGLKTGTD